MDEQVAYKEYTRIIHNYRLSFISAGIDIMDSMVPPSSLYINVRALNDVEIELDDDNAGVLKIDRGHQQVVKREQVERLIESGDLLHV